jgi:hypothetical protein
MQHLQRQVKHALAQLNELGGVKPLAFGQYGYGELGPGRISDLSSSWMDQLAEEGADEAAKRYLSSTSPPTA